jgi:hypothetical protein
MSSPVPSNRNERRAGGWARAGSALSNARAGLRSWAVWDKSGAVKLSPEMQRFVVEQRLAFVATVTADGRPNVSPKGTTTLFDEERLMFADLASPGTVENLGANPHVEVNVIDPILRKGFRFKGTAAVYTGDEMFERGLQILGDRRLTATRDRVHSIVVITVTSAAPVVSPAYDDGTTEETIVQRWLQHYDSLHRPQLG